MYCFSGDIIKMHNSQSVQSVRIMNAFSSISLGAMPPDLSLIVLAREGQEVNNRPTQS